MLVGNWAWGAQPWFVQGQSVLCMFLWGTETVKSLMGRGRVSQSSDLEMCPLGVAEGTQLVLL